MTREERLCVTSAVIKLWTSHIERRSCDSLLQKSRKTKTQTLTLVDFRTQTSTGTEERSMQQKQQNELQREEEEVEEEEENKVEKEEEQVEGEKERMKDEEQEKELQEQQGKEKVEEEVGGERKAQEKEEEEREQNEQVDPPPLLGKNSDDEEAVPSPEIHSTTGVQENENVSGNQLSDLLPSLSLSEENSTATLESHDPANQPNMPQAKVSPEEPAAVYEKQNADPSSARSHPSQYNPFSLEACLTNFCSLELLTGEDKFACEVCTKEWQQQCHDMASSLASLSPTRQPSADRLSGSGEFQMSESGEIGTSNQQICSLEEERVNNNEMHPVVCEPMQCGTEVVHHSTGVSNQKTPPDDTQGKSTPSVDNRTTDENIGGEKGMDGDNVVSSSASSSTTEFSFGQQLQEGEEELESAKESDGRGNSEGIVKSGC